MDVKEILKHVDHTLLSQTATWDEIRAICDDGVKYQTASVCIPPSYVAQAKEYVNGKTAVCTVIGFPNGYNTTSAKVFETEDAVKNGADEIDMVVNLGDVKNGNFEEVTAEIMAVREAAQGRLLKVIVETCYLTREEKIRICKCVTDAKADYIKTSTGFGSAGAQLEDIELFREHIGSDVKIKAAGGIRTQEAMEAFCQAGCSRIGCSAAIKALCGK